MVNKPLDELIQDEAQRIKALGAKDAIASLSYFNRHKVTSYLLRGHYADILEVWGKHIDPTRLLPLQSELLFEDPERTTRRVFDFLGVDQQEGIQYKKINSTSNWIKGDKKHPPVSDETLEKIASYYEPENQRLWSAYKKEIHWQTPTTFTGY